MSSHDSRREGEEEEEGRGGEEGKAGRAPYAFSSRSQGHACNWLRLYVYGEERRGEERRGEEISDESKRVREKGGGESRG